MTSVLGMLTTKIGGSFHTYTSINAYEKWGGQGISLSLYNEVLRTEKLGKSKILSKIKKEKKNLQKLGKE